MINKTEIKKVFSKKKLQINNEAMSMLEEHLLRQVNIMANRLIENNVKRLTTPLFWIALGNYNGPKRD